MSDQETIFDRELRPIVFQEVMSMPTTILDGESHEDARRRRFQEEAAIDARIAASEQTADLNGDLAEASQADARKYRQQRDELLAALELVLSWIDAWCPDFTDDPEWGADRDSMNAAIAKVKP